MEATNSHIHEKLINFRRSHCRELPKHFSFESKCLMFGDSSITTKNNKLKVNLCIFLILLNHTVIFLKISYYSGYKILISKSILLI